MSKDGLSPMMSLYVETKKEYPDCILFYRLGDFYEMFFEDAKIASRELELTLTGKSCGLPERAPMCGVPHHSASHYIEKLVSKGYKVAICEQVEDPKTASGLVKRDVVRVVTSGTLSDENMLSDKVNNYLAVCCAEDDFGMAFCDISTGEIYVTSAETPNDALGEIARYSPREILLNPEGGVLLSKDLKLKLALSSEVMDQDFFLGDTAKEHFGNNAESLKISQEYALSGLIKYLVRTQKNTLDFIKNITLYSKKEFMEIDAQSRRSLEIT